MRSSFTQRLTVVFVGAGSISRFATSYRSLALARALVESGEFDAHFLVAAHPDDEREYGAAQGGVRLHYIPDWPVRLTGWRYDPQLLVRCAARAWRRFARARGLRPHIAHVFKPLPETLLAGAALRAAGAQLVLDEDDADADMMAAAGRPDDAWRWLLTRALSRAGWRLCRGVTVASRALLRLYERRGAAAAYVPNGIFAREFAARRPPPPPEREVTVLYLGALEPCFDADVAIDAFAAARRRLPELRLLVVGDGSQRGALERRAADQGCAENVRFVGQARKDEVIDWLNQAHVFLFPMRRNWINESRCPLKLREFLAMGRPLIAPAFGEALEAAGASTDLVAPDADADAYAAKLVETARALREGRRPAFDPPPLEPLDWSRRAETLARLYRRIRRRGRPD